MQDTKLRHFQLLTWKDVHTKKFITRTESPTQYILFHNIFDGCKKMRATF